MCGRYGESKILAQVKGKVPFFRAESALKPRYNIAPTQMAPVIVNQGEAVLKDMRWGLIPFWAKDEEIGNRMINARAETVREKPSFRNSLKRKRCLVLADFFYEWQKIPGSTRKQPMCIHLRDQEPFVFAGLWDTWKKPDDAKDAEVESYIIITCEPNDLMRPIHHRMPVILKPDHYDQWLDPKNEDVDGLAKLLVPFPEKEMAAHPVSTLVNNPRFDDPRCIEPVK
jgi:putative SOS response-associated peptidase YedK